MSINRKILSKACLTTGLLSLLGLAALGIIFVSERSKGGLFTPRNELQGVKLFIAVLILSLTGWIISKRMKSD